MTRFFTGLKSWGYLFFLHSTPIQQQICHFNLQNMSCIWWVLSSFPTAQLTGPPNLGALRESSSTLRRHSGPLTKSTDVTPSTVCRSLHHPSSTTHSWIKPPPLFPGYLSSLLQPLCFPLVTPLSALHRTDLKLKSDRGSLLHQRLCTFPSCVEGSLRSSLGADMFFMSVVPDFLYDFISQWFSLLRTASATPDWSVAQAFASGSLSLLLFHPRSLFSWWSHHLIFHLIQVST